jgi:hypothetical protein
MNGETAPNLAIARGFYWMSPGRLKYSAMPKAEIFVDQKLTGAKHSPSVKDALGIIMPQTEDPAALRGL